MSKKSRFTLADISEALQLPLETIAAARYMLPIVPIDRDRDGTAFFDKAAVSKFYRLLKERDAAVLFEPNDADAWLRYLKAQVPGVEFIRRELTAEERKFDELLAAGDVEACERMLDEEWPN